MAEPAVESQSWWRDYLSSTRDLTTSLVLVLPLFVLYQVGILASDGIKNGVDFITPKLWMLSGGERLNYLGLNLLILVVFVGVLFGLRRREAFRPKLLAPVLAESVVYAIFSGGAVLQLMSALGLQALLASGAGGGEFGLVQKLVLSLGAGFYEELVFRLFLMGGLYGALTRWAKDIPVWVSAGIAVVFSSLVFSAIHHFGALGDPFTLGVFLFRFFAGVLLALIFYLRGFAVAVYTHAIYDIIVMVFRGG